MVCLSSSLPTMLCSSSNLEQGPAWMSRGAPTLALRHVRQVRGMSRIIHRRRLSCDDGVANFSHFFSSPAIDKTVIVCELGKDEPVMVFDGHEDEVNFIRWDPTGHYLASCSDDCTAKVKSSGTLRFFLPLIALTQLSPSCCCLIPPVDSCTTPQIWTLDRPSYLHSFRHDDKVYSLTWNRAVETNFPLMMAR